jgi:putative transposase
MGANKSSIWWITCCLSGVPPDKITVDDRPKFISRALDHWASVSRLILDLSRPSNPTDNTFLESFNGRLRDEYLNANWYLSPHNAKTKIEALRTDFNEVRPHTSLEFKTSAEFVSSAWVTPGR